MGGMDKRKPVCVVKTGLYAELSVFYYLSRPDLFTEMVESPPIEI